MSQKYGRKSFTKKQKEIWHKNNLFMYTKLFKHIFHIYYNYIKYLFFQIYILQNATNFDIINIIMNIQTKEEF